MRNGACHKVMKDRMYVSRFGSRAFLLAGEIIFATIIVNALVRRKTNVFTNSMISLIFVFSILNVALFL